MAIFTYPGAQILDVTGPSEVFAIASEALSRAQGVASPAYRVEILAPSAGPVPMSSGLQLVADRAFRGDVAAIIGKALEKNADLKKALAESMQDVMKYKKTLGM